jgi:3',5'-cyclic AMP phosphodiesterase CpdA
MNRRALILAAVLIAGAGAACTQRSPATSSTTGPAATAGADPAGLAIVLGRPTDRSVAVSVSTTAAAQVALRWRSTAAWSSSPPVTVAPGPPHVVEVTGLAPDTAYTYQVVVDGAAGAEHRFHTQRRAGSTFVVGIEADAHHGDPNSSPEVWDVTLRNMRADRPDFVVDLGDLFMTEKLGASDMAAVTDTIAGVRGPLSTVGADAPVLFVNGNHEGELGWLIGSGRTPELPRWSTLARQASYPVPVPGAFYRGATTTDPTMGDRRDSWYAWTWGDAQFIVLDPFWYTTRKPRNGSTVDNWNWTLGREQYEWLRATLAVPGPRYRFVFVHHLVGGDAEARGGVEAAAGFEWGGRNPDGTDGFAANRPGWEAPIHELLVRAGVSAVYHGHDHVYVRQDLDGIVYHELAQPSASRPDNTRLAEEYGYRSGTVLGSSGHLRLTIGPDKAVAEYVRAWRATEETANRRNGEVADRYVMGPR